MDNDDEGPPSSLVPLGDAGRVDWGGGEAVRVQVGADAREGLEAGQVGLQLRVVRHQLGLEPAVVGQDLVAVEVREGRAVAPGQPVAVAQEGLQLLQLEREGLHVAGAHLLL